MQKLDLKKAKYTFDDIKELVEKLESKKIITHKEAEAINISKVYQFTKSKIWEEMIHAHVVQREKSFYIKLPAKEIYQKDLEELFNKISLTMDAVSPTNIVLSSYIKGTFSLDK